MRRPSRALIVLGLLLCLMAPSAAADDDIRVDARLDRRVLYEGESFTLTLDVAGPMRGIGTPRLPDMADFALVGTSSSTSYSIINGHASGSKTFNYSLIPLKSGELGIPAIPVKVKDRDYYSSPIKVQVRAAQNPAPQGQPGQRTQPSLPPEHRQESEDDRRVFIRSWADQDTVYVGQQLTHHFALFRDPRARFLGAPQYSPPDLTGFWTEPLGDEISGFQVYQGQNYAVTELRSALFPQESGRLEIGGATVQVRLRGSNTWDLWSFDSGTERVLRSPVISVQVLPLPSAGKPQGFSGSVASELGLEARVDKGPYEVGQPITLRITLSGVGNPRAFGEPELPPSDDFKYYDSEMDSKTSVDENRIFVKKEFTRVVVPRSEGELTLPGVSYAWFDPDKGRYRSSKTRDIVLAVAPSSSESSEPVVFSDLTPERVKVLGTSIHHIKTDPLLAGDGKRFPRSSGFWIALLLPFPLLGGALAWRLRKDRLQADVLGARARGAKRQASRRLKAAGTARDAGDFDAFCAELAAALRGYLADRLALSAAGLTSDQADAALTAAGASAEARREALQLLADCDFARYAPGAEQQARMDALFDRAGRAMDRLEGEIGGKFRAARFSLGTRLFSVLLLASAGAALSIPALARAQAAANPGEAMARAAERYEAGEFGEAAEIWTQLAKDGVADSHLWYNLGNAYFQDDELGRAILAYRRAQRLAPRDAEIRDNLALARARRPDGPQESSSGFLGRAWQGLRSSVSPGELAVAGLVLLWLCALSLLLIILRRASWRRLRWLLVPALVLLPLVSLAAWTAEWQDWSGKEAVLMAPSVSVQSGPGLDFVTLFEIHEGAELRILERRGNWILANLGPDLEGWIPRNAVEAL